MRSHFVHECRKTNPIGLWMPPEAGIARDVSGNERHGIGAAGASGFMGYSSDQLSRFPMWRTSSFSNDGLIAPIPAIADNAITLMARVYNDNLSSHRGAFIYLTNLGNRGIGIGVGNGSSFESAGTAFGALNNTVAWHWTGVNFNPGWNWAACICGTGANGMKFYLNGALVFTTTLANMAAGTVTEAHIGGYSTSGRTTDYGVGHTVYWDRLVSEGELIHLSNCNINEREDAA